jgi:hypothetical protein
MGGGMNKTMGRADPSLGVTNPKVSAEIYIRMLRDGNPKISAIRAFVSRKLRILRI